MQSLKSIARDQSVPLIAISEITKQAMDSALVDGQLSTDCFKGGSSIVHVADTLMVLQSDSIEIKDIACDQLDLHYKGIGKPHAAEIDQIRTDYPEVESASSTFARLSILRSRNGQQGDIMFRYDKAFHDFTPIDLRSYPKKEHTRKSW
jgi:replicative DNA helicase